jgi:hypothetical protein
MNATQPFRFKALGPCIVTTRFMTNNTFAERLDRAIDASNRAKVIEGRVIERDD